MDLRGSEPVECHVVCGHADNDPMPRVEKCFFSGDWARLAPSFAIMMWISTWHNNNMCRQQWLAKFCHTSGVLCLGPLKLEQVRRQPAIFSSLPLFT